MPQLTITATGKHSEFAAILKHNGFVHVTGLPMMPNPLECEDKTDEDAVIIRASSHECGRWDYNNGFTVVITLEGEVWLLSGEMSLDFRVEFLKKICPYGRGAYVPGSNGESLSYRHILERNRNPYSNVLPDTPFLIMEE